MNIYQLIFRLQQLIFDPLQLHFADAVNWYSVNCVFKKKICHYSH